MCEWWEEEFRKERVCRQGEQHMQITRAKEYHSKSEDLQLVQYGLHVTGRGQE